MTTPITFRGYHPGNGDTYVMPDRITHFDRLERGGTRIVLDTGKEVWVDAWPQDVAKAIAKAQQDAQLRPAIAEISKLQLGPGEALAVKVEGRLRQEHADHLRNYVRQHIPEGIHVLVMDGGMSLQVVEQSEGEAR